MILGVPPILGKLRPMESHGDLVASGSSSPGGQKLQIRLRDMVNPRHTAPGPQVVASCCFKVNDSQCWNGEKHKSINCQTPGKKKQWYALKWSFMTIYFLYPMRLIFVCETCSVNTSQKTLSIAHYGLLNPLASRASCSTWSLRVDTQTETIVILISQKHGTLG